VPWRHIRYDNLSPAVAKVLRGRSRTETARWLAFRSWYGFEAFYCEPGPGGAHEKGGVEGDLGRFRRRWLVPVPKAASLAELNAVLAEADASEDGRHIAYRAATVGEDFTAEQAFLRPLPSEPFDTAATLWPLADRYARVSIGKCRYSVPACLIGSRVRAVLSANELRIFDGSRLVAAHPVPSTWSWTITWRSWCASLARWLGRPRWPRPAPPGCSHPCMRRSGLLRGPGMVIAPGPGH